MRQQPGNREPLQVMPEHGGWMPRGSLKSVSDACDAFFASRGEKKLTLQDLRERYFERVRRGRARKGKAKPKAAAGDTAGVA